MKLPCTEVRCEVLIVGGGLAALVAALEAKKLVDEVVIVSKSKIGRSGSTVVSQCKFGAYVGFDTPGFDTLRYSAQAATLRRAQCGAQPKPHAGSPDSAQRHFQDTLVGGRFINDETLVSILASQAGQRLLELEQYGVRFHKTSDGFLRESGPGHSCPRTIPTCSKYPYAVLGLSITLPLLQEAKSRGVRLIENSPVVRLALHDGQVCGAIGLDVKGEKVLRGRPRGESAGEQCPDRGRGVRPIAGRQAADYAKSLRSFPLAKKEDFPSSDENWLGSVKVTKSADGLELNFLAK
jgi:succinate dehydrogenase/fumarate reductase flavoprotein subunit